MSFGLAELTVPIVGAPMAGGPSTPALAAAVTEAGGLGFLATGLVSAGRVASDIAHARASTTGPIGVNLFVPQPSIGEPGALDAYGHALAPLAERFGVEIGRTHPDDDAYADKLEVVLDLRPEVVSFTFGSPEPLVVERLHDAGVSTIVTVTGPYEAGVAVAAGADALVVQGPEAGGHRGIFAPDVKPPDEPLPEVFRRVAAVVDVPIIAAGGLSSASDVATVLGWGAVAAQVGTALLCADEAGTNHAHREALLGGAFTETVVTAAFTGRYARGLLNEFARTYDAVAPLGYPDVHQLTAAIKRASVASNDPQATNLWAGTGFATVRTGSAGAIVAELAP
ncbi:MAG: nitronate monooxygenase [Mycobacterium sp.]